MPALVEERSTHLRSWVVPTPAAGVKRGEFHQIGDVWGFSTSTVPDPTSGPTASTVGEMPGTNVYNFVWQCEGGGGLRVPKDPPQTISRGTRAYFHPVHESFTDVASGANHVGFWRDDYLPGDTFGIIDFDGRLYRL